MSFLDTVSRAKTYLREHLRVSLRGLKREFHLDDDGLDELISELVEVQQVAAREGNVLVWVESPARDTTATTTTGVEAQPDTLPMPEGATAPPSARKGAEGERRQLTVMFCDLVGSTELSQRLDPEELSEIVREYRAVCVDATERFDGHVAQYLGDGVMIYFGYPQAHEDDAGRALRAGLEIQRVLRVRPEARRIDARIGIHTGLVVIDPTRSGDDGLALGATSNVAARIESTATPGTVVASDATLALCRGAFITRNLGETQLKGVEAQIVLHEVVSNASVRTAATTDATKPMVGRDHEVGLLLDRWQEVQDGRGQVVLISGEPGMGKSRLLQALREELAQAPHLWLDMQCSPFTSGSAFQPLVNVFHTALRFSVAESPEETSRQLVAGFDAVPGLPGEKVIPYLLPILGLPASERYPLPQTSAEEQRNRTLAAIVQIIHTLCEQQPVVLATEDLHWSDPSTLELLGRLVEQAPTSRLLLLLTFRPEFRTPWTQSHVAEVKLAPLSRRVTREMLTNAVGGRLPEPVLAELEARSDGVPLFVEELASNVVSSGVFTEQAGRDELRGSLDDLAIPATLQDSLMARLDRLSATKKLAQQAATVGREFSYELIEAITDLDPPALRSALDQLATAEIVHPRGTPPDATYTFKHTLLQDTAYESQLLSTRKALHGKIAEVLEARFPKRVAAEPERMARHCAAAEQFAKAVDYYERAAELAVARLANEEASAYYGRALDALAALPENAERHQREIAIRVAQGKALWTLHGFEAPEVVETFARVETLCEAVGEGPQQLPARIGLLRLHVSRVETSVAREQAEAILRIAEPLGVPELLVMSHVVIGMALLTSSSVIEAEARIAKGLAIVESIDFPPPETPHDIDLVAWAHVSHASALAHLARPEQAARSVELCYARACEIDHDFTRALALALPGFIGFTLYDPEFAQSGTEEALALARGRGYHAAEQMAWIYRGWARACLGEVDEGVRDVEKGLAIKEASGVTGMPSNYVAPAHVYRMAGQRERADELLDRATALYKRSGERTYHSRACFARALILLELGDGAPTDVERLLLEAVETAASFDHLQMELVVSTHLARLAPRTGKLREAHDRLAGHYARLTEGFDRRPAREAKAALDELAARLDAEPGAS